MKSDILYLPLGPNQTKSANSPKKITNPILEYLRRDPSSLHRSRKVFPAFDWSKYFARAILESEPVFKKKQRKAISANKIEKTLRNKMSASITR